jgi:hypothetical protein
MVLCCMQEQLWKPRVAGVISAACRRKEIVKKWLAFTVGVVLSAGTVLAASESSLSGPSVQQPEPIFKALAQVMAPIGLTAEQLAQIQGQGIVLANSHALPPGNPGTSTAVLSIPSAVFVGHVRDQWFGKAAGK